jgi:PAS domain S-box-containing protein
VREVVGRHKAGHVIPLELILDRLPALEGHGRSVFAAILDISERKAAAEALNKANREQTAIFESARTGIVLFKRRTIVHANPAFLKLFGYRADELLGQNARVLHIDDAHYQAIGAEAYPVIERGETYQGDIELQRKDGSTFQCHLIGSAVDPDDPDEGVVWLMEDVSYERQATEAIKRARHEAEEATRMKSEFLANMSHEIRTPMNAIIGMTHLALQTDLDRQQRNYLEKVERAGQNLLGIINDILDFSKIEAGKLVMESIDFRLEDVMDNLANLITLKTEEKGLELLFDVKADLPTALVGDPLRLGQVLINLGNNAAKFTEKGEVVIGVEVVSQDERRGRAAFLGQGHRHRHEQGAEHPAVRGLQPGRRLDHPPLRRHRAGAGDLQEPGRDDGRAAVGRASSGAARPSTSGRASACRRTLPLPHVLRRRAARCARSGGGRQRLGPGDPGQHDPLLRARHRRRQHRRRGPREDRRRGGRSSPTACSCSTGRCPAWTASRPSAGSRPSTPSRSRRW